MKKYKKNEKTPIYVSGTTAGHPDRKEMKMNRCVIFKRNRFKPFSSDAKRKKTVEEEGKKKKSKSRRIPENMQEELAKARKKALRRLPYRVLY